MNMLLAGLVLVLVVGILVAGGAITIINFPWRANRIGVVPGRLPTRDLPSSNIRRLSELGFQPLGILDNRLFWRPRLARYLWYYVDATSATVAVVTTYQGETTDVMIQLETWFDDNALIETYLPIGENIETPNFSAHFVKHDLELGYQHHQAVIQRWMETHGSPLVFRDVSELIPFDAVDRVVHRRRRYRRLTLTLIGIIVLSIISSGSLLVVIAGNLVETLGSQMNGQLFLPATLLLLCFAGIGALLYQVVNPPGRWTAETTRLPYILHT